MTNTPTADDTALDPAEALALIGRQQEATGKQIAREIPGILLAWGIAWTVGFGMLWLIDGAAPAFSIPLPVAAIVFGVLTVAAMVASGIIGTRAQRGIRQTRAEVFTGTVYGSSATAGIVSLGVLGLALVAHGMPADLLVVLYPVGVGLIIGFLYLMGAAIWRGVPMLILGAWLIVVSLGAAFVGAPHHFLVLAVAGGGGFLVGAVALARAIRAKAA